MTLSLAWLDFSGRDQRQAREITQLFLQPESPNEEGVGTAAGLSIPGGVSND